MAITECSQYQVVQINNLVNRATVLRVKLRLTLSFAVPKMQHLLKLYYWFSNMQATFGLLRAGTQQLHSGTVRSDHWELLSSVTTTNWELLCSVTTDSLRTIVLISNHWLTENYCAHRPLTHWELLCWSVTTTNREVTVLSDHWLTENYCAQCPLRTEPVLKQWHYFITKLRGHSIILKSLNQACKISTVRPVTSRKNRLDYRAHALEQCCSLKSGNYRLPNQKLHGGAIILWKMVD